MRASDLLLPTLRETPADAEVVSHQLMLRAGMISRLAAGLYNWLPLGLRVLRRVEQVVREEMDATGAQEVLMPAVQPAQLWQESGRWEKYGPELLRLRDRHGNDFCFGPTHEEVVTDLVRRNVRSYRDLPLNLYQIQGKFRDEIRPRFGIMRAREFLMKDAYSFHLDDASLDETYQAMYQAYSRIFTRLGLRFRAVDADTGSIGGRSSHEFHVLAESGEDAIAFSDKGDFAANVELAPVVPPAGEQPHATQPLETVATPAAQSVSEVAGQLGVPASRVVKTLLVQGSEAPLVALLLRGDRELNPVKAAALAQVASPLVMADAEAIVEACGAPAGSIGPVGLQVPVIADQEVLLMADFVCGANKEGFHLTGVNWGRDLPPVQGADLRMVVAGDEAPDGGLVRIARGIEVGHIFSLGDTYSRAMGATVLDEQGRERVMSMGCYGIGVSRVVAAAIEQNHDDNGILWPDSLAPFQVALAPINAGKSATVAQAVDQLYDQLLEAGYPVLLDDRQLRPGVMFADLDLIGIPHRLVIGDRKLAQGLVEYKSRRDGEVRDVPVAEVMDFLARRVNRPLG